MLNTRMEKGNLEYFTMSYQLRTLYLAFVKKTEKGDDYQTPVLFAKAFDEVFKCMQMGNQYYTKYEKQKQKEVALFSGR